MSDESVPPPSPDGDDPDRVAPGQSGWWPTRLVGLAVIVAVAGLAMFVLRDAPMIGRQQSRPTPSLVQRTTTSSFEIEAVFYRANGAQMERLNHGQPVSVKDQLSLSITTTAPTHLYVINEDERDDAFLLFPLPDQILSNPLPPNREVRVPANHNWEVSSVGGREHFLIFASRERLSAFEDVFRLLPVPRLGGLVKLPPSTLQHFRVVGGLARADAKPPVTPTRFHTLFTQPLAGRETVDGLWVRQLTLANAGPRP